MSELLVLVGLQGAGKSSFYRQRFAATHAHVSKDLLGSARDKDARQERLIREALAHGRPVVVDNTNVTRAARARLLEIAKPLGARTACYFFPAPPEECLPRNHAREGKARVHPAAIWMTWKKLEPPSPEEGFDELWRVRLQGSEFLLERIV